MDMSRAHCLDPGGTDASMLLCAAQIYLYVYSLRRGHADVLQNKLHMPQLESEQNWRACK